jgi:hypothetical protein
LKKAINLQDEKKIANFLQHVQASSQNVKRFLIFLLSCLVYNQIWLCLLVDDFQFG